MKILVHITVSIFVTNVLELLLVSRVISSSAFCEAVAILLHFSILSQLSWMTVMSMEMVHTFFQAYRMIPVSREASCRKFFLYSIIAWSAPLLIVATCVVLNYTTSGVIEYGRRTEHESRTCWINDSHSLIAAFITPVALAVLMQFALYIPTVILLCVSRQQKAKDSVDSSNVPYFRILLVVFFTTGMKWMFGFMAMLIKTEWAWYPFIIFLSFQGIIIFIGFFGTKKVLKLYVSFFSDNFTKYKSNSTRSVPVKETLG